MKREIVAGMFLAGAIVACSDGVEPASQTETSQTAASPTHPSEQVESECVARGDALVQSFFDALNQADSTAVKTMFLTGEPIEFSVVPDITAAAETSVLEAVRVHRSSQALELDDIDGVISETSGLTFVLTTAVQGGTYIDLTGTGKLMYGFGPVLWMATGPALESRGRTAVNGGGKIAIDCETGLFQKVLLSPLSFE